MQKREEAPNKLSKIPISFLIYGVVGILSGIALLLLFSLLSANELISESFLSSVPPLAAFSGALISGYFAARAMGKALLTGIIQSIVNFFILYFLCILVFMRIKPTSCYLYIFLACVFGAVVGSLITVIRVKGHRRRSA